MTAVDDILQEIGEAPRPTRTVVPWRGRRYHPVERLRGQRLKITRRPPARTFDRKTEDPYWQFRRYHLLMLEDSDVQVLAAYKCVLFD